MRDLRPDATDAEALVSIDCDLCGRVAPERGRCDADDAHAAAILADWLRYRCGWRRAGRMIVCPDCRRTPK